eukprot:scaffold15472_cov117-Cylindrotheca_fusiformis.AAC.28
MSFKRDPNEFDDEEEEEDDDSDEEEGEFVPGVDEDEDEDDADSNDFDTTSSMDEPIPTFLQGDFSLDPTDNETIIYKQNGSFCLKSQEKVPPRWSLQNPLLQEPIRFGGWIGDPTEWIDFHLQISKLHNIDSMDEKTLKAQHERLLTTQTQDDSKFAQETNGNDHGEKICKPPPSSTAKVKAEMKSPPPYSLSKAPPSVPHHGIIQPPQSEKSRAQNAYSISGLQVEQNERCIKFRGVFYAADSGQNELFLICSVRVDDGGDGTTNASSTASAAAQGSNRKRDRVDDIAGSNGVDYQELIDLHNEANISTEELKTRYSHKSSVEGMVSTRSKVAKHPKD